MIPVNEPDLSGNEKAYLAECIDSGWISSEGPFVQRLEEGVAQRCDRAFGVAVCNGTAALDVAVAALGIGAGDEVILPTFTIISCASAIVRAGATPVLVDCDSLTWNMDVVEASITPRTKAIMVVHMYGLPVDMDPILALAERHGLAVIEDAAEAIGQRYRDRPCGSFGHISTFSFYPNKHITTGEGGMVLTNDSELAERCRRLRNLCFGQKDRFRHEELGWNYRMSNLQAAVGVAQLERLDETIARKRTIGQWYNAALADIDEIQLPLPRCDYAENVYWVYGIVLKKECALNAEDVMGQLKRAGIGSRPFFWPMHEQPVFLEMGLFADERYPVAENLARRGLYVPSGVTLSQAQVAEVASTLKEALR
jgi:perosamine synthetase